MDVEIKNKLQRIKVLFTDVDGVLTDGGLYYSESGDKVKRFHVRDGLGIKLLQKAGIEVAFITGLSSNMVTNRANDLAVQHVVQDCFDKDVAAEAILAELGLGFDQAAFVADDLIDIGLLKKVLLPVAVPGAVSAVKDVADFVTDAAGGQGAVREVADMILAAQKGL